jgi:hypothetical protein
LDEALQLFFTQAIIAAIQVHDFHKVTVGPAGPSARGFRQIERLAGMADDQPKWLLEDRKLVPFKRFESRFKVQVAVPAWIDIEGAEKGRGLATCPQASPQVLLNIFAAVSLLHMCLAGAQNAVGSCTAADVVNSQRGLNRLATCF